jgi:hypothetical protein
VSPTEKEVQRAIIRLYQSVGCVVYSTSQVRASRVSEGTPDLYVFPPRGKPAFWHEVKAPGGVLSDDQQRFRALCRAAGAPHIVGGLDVAHQMLETLGILRRTA